MVQVIVLVFTVFVGWVILDFVKHKKFSKENILTALISAIVAGVAYYVLFGIF